MENYRSCENYGRITQIYPTCGGTFFKLGEGKTAIDPKDGYYYIPVDHDNYSAMIDLLFRAAENRRTISVRTARQLNAKGHASVTHLVAEY